MLCPNPYLTQCKNINDAPRVLIKRYLYLSLGVSINRCVIVKDVAMTLAAF